MATDNHTTIVGNLVDDPELRVTNSGTAVANMRVAVTQRIQDNGTWRDGETSFFRVNCWRHQRASRRPGAAGRAGRRLQRPSALLNLPLLPAPPAGTGGAALWEAASPLGCAALSAGALLMPLIGRAPTVVPGGARAAAPCCAVPPPMEQPAQVSVTKVTVVDASDRPSLVRMARRPVRLTVLLLAAIVEPWCRSG